MNMVLADRMDEHVAEAVDVLGDQVRGAAHERQARTPCTATRDP